MADKPFNNPFEGLKGRLVELPPGPGRAPKEKPAGPARAVVRLERKGRRGKEVTVLSHLSLEPTELDAWLSKLKNALGCGGAVEQGALVLQGDHRDRLSVLLSGMGVRKVVIGS